MTENAKQHIWPALLYEDAPAAIEFLTEAFGFEKRAVHESEPGVIVHAELSWPEGGAIMLSSAGAGESPFNRRQTGNDAMYVVSSDPDAIFERARAAGAEVLSRPADTDYGSRDVSFRDPEGNLWDFGTYAGEASDASSAS